MENQTEDCFSDSSSTMSYLAYGASRSNMSPPPGQDWGASALEMPAGRNLYECPDFVEKRSEWYKNLDFEDAIFIPNFCTDEPPEPAHAPADLQQRADPRSHVRQQHVRPSSPVMMAPRAGAWHLGPQNTPVAVNEQPVGISIPTPATTTPESDRPLSTPWPNWHSRPSNQAGSWRTPPSSHTPPTPSYSTPGGSRGASRHTQLIAREIAAQQERNRQLGSGACGHFMPSRAVLERTRPAPLNPASPLPTPTRSTRNANHYGRADLPEDENCAIYVVGIPARATYADVLGAVRGGKIYVCLMDPPCGQHPTAAAKLVFFTRAAAERFMQRHHSVGVYIRGQRVRAMWNRIRYAACARRPPHQSRVVVVSGPRRWMDFAFFETFFGSRFEFQEEARSERPCDRAGRVVHVWRFASVRAQAELAYIAIERELGDIFEVEYGPDPCAQPWM